MAIQKYDMRQPDGAFRAARVHEFAGPRPGRAARIHHPSRRGRDRLRAAAGAAGRRSRGASRADGARGGGDLPQLARGPGRQPAPRAPPTSSSTFSYSPCRTTCARRCARSTASAGLVVEDHAAASPLGKREPRPRASGAQRMGLLIDDLPASRRSRAAAGAPETDMSALPTRSPSGCHRRRSAASTSRSSAALSPRSPAAGTGGCFGD